MLVGDNSYAVLDLLHCCQSLREPVTLIARLRLDAALYAPAPARQPGQNGRPRLKGARRPPLKTLLGQADVTWTSTAVAWYDGTTRTVELTSQTAVWYRSGKPPVLIRWVLIRDPQGAFATQALLCTDPAADPTQILEWFVLRWQLEVTFQEVRTRLGVETQRQWSDRAIARTTPILLGLFSWTTLAAHGLQKQRPMTQRRAAWYDKPSPTFVDAIALVRRHLWLASEGFSLLAASQLDFVHLGGVGEDVGELSVNCGWGVFSCRVSTRLPTNQRCHAAIGAPGGVCVVRSPASDIGTSW